MLQTICEIKPLMIGYLVELTNPDGSAAKVKVYRTLAAARGVCTRWANAWQPGPVGITCTYPDGEQRVYAYDNPAAL